MSNIQHLRLMLSSKDLECGGTLFSALFAVIQQEVEVPGKTVSIRYHAMGFYKKADLVLSHIHSRLQRSSDIRTALEHHP